MKKVSTVAAEQSRNFSQQKLTIGLDLVDRSSYYCVVEESGRMVAERKEEASHRRHSEKARRLAALPVGERRSLRTVAEQQSNGSADSSLKTF
jgi:hypothetical protein